MNRILIFILTSFFLSSCKTSKVFTTEGLNTMEITQNRQFIQPDSSREITFSPIVFTASTDSSVFTNYNTPLSKQIQTIKKIPNIKEFSPKKQDKVVNEPAGKVSKSKGIRLFIPTALLIYFITGALQNSFIWLWLVGMGFAILLFLLLNTNIFGITKGHKNKRSKAWQILVALFFLLSSLAFVIVAPGKMVYTGVLLVVVAIMMLLFAIINNLLGTQPKHNLSREQKNKSPYNKLALWAGIFFLTFLILTITPHIIFIPYLFIFIYFSFITASILSILALIDLERKATYERGKLLAFFIFFVTLIPFILFLLLIGEDFVYKIRY